MREATEAERMGRGKLTTGRRAVVTTGRSSSWNCRKSMCGWTGGSRTSWRPSPSTPLKASPALRSGTCPRPYLGGRSRCATCPAPQASPSLRSRTCPALCRRPAASFGRIQLLNPRFGARKSSLLNPRCGARQPNALPAPRAKACHCDGSPVERRASVPCSALPVCRVVPCQCAE